MKSILRAMVIILSCVAVMGNGVAGTNVTKDLAMPIKQSDFCLGGIKLGDDFNKLKNAFEPGLVMVSRSLWGYDGQYHSLWRNANIEIRVCETKNALIIEGVRLLSEKFSTNQGVKIGMLSDKVFSGYGTVHQCNTVGNTSLMLYNQEAKANPFIPNLIFDIDTSTNKVKSIAMYTALVE